LHPPARDSLAQQLQLPDQEEQADTQHRTQEPEGSQFLPYNELIHCKTMGVAPVTRKQKCSGSHEADNQPAETCHFPPVDYHQQECPGYTSQNQAHDPQEQVPPRSAYGCHSQHQHHPEQSEAYDGEEETTATPRAPEHLPPTSETKKTLTTPPQNYIVEIIACGIRLAFSPRNMHVRFFHVF
ncbi:unnamed protein product, partial [Gulo gulo]